MRSPCGMSNCSSNPVVASASASFAWLVSLLYGAVFLVAMAGNGLVLYTVLGTPRMRSATNLLLLNLALGDLLLAAFCVPFSALSTLLLQYWPFGELLCRSVSFSQATCVLVSSYTLLAVSADRCYSVRWPLRPRMRRRQALVVMASLWTGALATASPIALVSTLEQPTQWYRDCGRFVCQESWSSEHARYVYSMVLLTLQYVVPLIALIFTYSLIAYLVWGQRMPGEDYILREIRMARSKRKMIKMMVTVVVVYTVCWLPFNSLLIVVEHDADIGEWPGLPYLFLACHWLAMSHSCYNPIIYCWLNARFRAAFCRAFSFLPVVKNRPSSSNANDGGLVRQHSAVINLPACYYCNVRDAVVKSTHHKCKNNSKGEHKSPDLVINQCTLTHKVTNGGRNKEGKHK